jgi:hypothetical protein
MRVLLSEKMKVWKESPGFWRRERLNGIRVEF